MSPRQPNDTSSSMHIKNQTAHPAPASMLSAGNFASRAAGLKKEVSSAQQHH
jgi:hypothetical protein